MPLPTSDTVFEVKVSPAGVALNCFQISGQMDEWEWNLRVRKMKTYDIRQMGGRVRVRSPAG